MGWVSQKFTDEQTIAKETNKLWDQVRDSIGLAAEEYNEWVGDAPAGEVLEATDCTARARLCIRLHKSRAGDSLEIFLDAQNKLLKTAKRGEEERTVCSYRLNADRDALEFFAVPVEQHDEPRKLSIDAACELAAGEFIFTPFPRVLNRQCQ